MKARVFIPLALCCATTLAQKAVVERIKFQAYDGEPGKTPPSEMTYQVNPLDASGRTKFVKIGDMIEGTRWRVVKFEYKEAWPGKTGSGQPVEASELTLEHLDTKRTVTLILNKTVNVAE